VCAEPCGPGRRSDQSRTPRRGRRHPDLGPALPEGQGGNDTTDAAYYLAANRGKKSILLDIATPAGQQAVRELAKISDVVLENYKVGQLKKYGLDYDSLKAVNPGLVYCSVTGFGQTGPSHIAPATTSSSRAWAA
jgi:crotonobetainyl-CoA:carnitine CoA-transferase CaiB-like acyl-CoA transferase